MHLLALLCTSLAPATRPLCTHLAPTTSTHLGEAEIHQNLALHFHQVHLEDELVVPPVRGGDGDLQATVKGEPSGGGLAKAPVPPWPHPHLVGAAPLPAVAHLLADLLQAAVGAIGVQLGEEARHPLHQPLPRALWAQHIPVLWGLPGSTPSTAGLRPDGNATKLHSCAHGSPLPPAPNPGLAAWLQAGAPPSPHPQKCTNAAKLHLYMGNIGKLHPLMANTASCSLVQ